jgi:hypothetical protein
MNYRSSKPPVASTTDRRTRAHQRPGETGGWICLEPRDELLEKARVRHLDVAVDDQHGVGAERERAGEAEVVTAAVPAVHGRAHELDARELLLHGNVGAVGRGVFDDDDPA